MPQAHACRFFFFLLRLSMCKCAKYKYADDPLLIIMIFFLFISSLSIAVVLYVMLSAFVMIFLVYSFQSWLSTSPICFSRNSFFGTFKCFQVSNSTREQTVYIFLSFISLLVAVLFTHANINLQPKETKHDHWLQLENQWDTRWLKFNKHQ